MYFPTIEEGGMIGELSDGGGTAPPPPDLKRGGHYIFRSTMLSSQH
jgi:hypothetical protein